MPPNIDFRTIRPDADGSRNLGFEELCCQLIPALENLPEGAELERHGTLDGGVEMLAKLPNGSVWAWQAKYLFSLTSAEFKQLDKSVKRALETYPRITRYTFCLPYNRPAGKSRGKITAMEKWEQHCTKWKGWASDRGMKVDFHYVGHSELLAALTLPGQAGRALYWFDATILTPEWFKATVDHAIEDAGPRYTPELNVELPIVSVFDGLARTNEFETRLRTTLRGIRDARRRWSLSRDIPQQDAALLEKIHSCHALLDDVDERVLAIRIAGTSPIDFDGLAGCCDGTMKVLENLAETFTDKASEGVRNQQRQARESEQERRTRQAWESAAWQLRRTASAVEDLKSMLVSDAACLVNVPALLIQGKAGTGKTHLLCDVARARCDGGQPTVMLLGQQFNDTEPWAQILNQLQLNCSVDEFLGALDVAAEAAGSRALIFIDAINEGQGLRLWPQYLAGFLETVRRWPRVGVALSSRSSYVDVVLPEQLDKSKLVRVTHHGFAGHEYDAVRTFFEYYKLKLPDFPLLVPEFQNPLFLKLMCRALNQKRASTIPRGSTGVTWLFGLFLSSVEKTLSKAECCNYPEQGQLVRKAVDAVAAEMLVSDKEWLPFESVKTLTENLLPNRGWDKSLFRGLLSEGVLMQERVYDNGGQAEGLLFSYQRLGDHLRAAILCGGSRSVDDLTPELRRLAADRWTAYRHSGLLEALSVQIPERFDRELHQLVPDPLLEPIQDAYLESIIWRDAGAFPSPLSLDYLNTIPRSPSWGLDPVLTTILQVACVPGHPFNARLLHSNLFDRSMPLRDGWWSVFLHWNYGEDSPVTSIIDWARSEDTSYCADDAALLCAITLAWLLTSSNRALRDRATKALVSLLKDRPNVLVDLLDQFHNVNDPYVAERLYAVAYGCSLVTAKQVDLAKLAQAVYSQVFAGGEPPVHILLRDYARGVVERARQLGCLPRDVDLAKVRPPYRSPWPLRPPMKESLEKRYDDDRDDRDDRDWRSIWWSVMSSMGDFNRYIIESAVSKFVAPNQRARRAAARQAAKARALEYRDRSPVDQPITFDADLASRWIFSRVVKLGWTPKRFAQFDRLRAYDFSRTEHRDERIGKKYQWIAFHELVARIADHCRLEPGWGTGKSTAYDGPWQLWIRDLDPSFLLSSTKALWLDTAPQCWWAPAAAELPHDQAPRTQEHWVQSEAGLPAPTTLIDLTDGAGRRWLTLEAQYRWQQQVPPEIDRYDVDRCSLWYQIRSYLVRMVDLPSFQNWAKGKNWMGRRMPESYDTHEVFLGEYPWHPSAAETLSTWVERDEHLPGQPVPRVPVLTTSARYMWEASGYDSSLDDSVSGFLPASPLISALGLTWDGKDFRYVDARGKLIVCDPTAAESGPPALLVDYDSLAKYLNAERLAIVWTILGEKLILGPSVQTRPRLQVYGSFALEQGALQQIHFETSLDRRNRGV